ncbi:hypothetical protein [Allomuricauda sp. NBRC 101325]|uniref:hypothetical protein n=1 Tax=Allomuricauda sp. NBRC 101325 TaxID=1113758 RepID=UPI0024A3B9AE|nr:hypothetical protein [Muricauda sp. NBRC 101325]GLU44742.1 hypothetical protein Musp01_23660 [Muricauda sp. NBRC 101325]
MKKGLLAIFSLMYVGIYAQEKTHPNNPSVIITDEAPEKWRILSDDGKYLEAASELLFLLLSDSSRNAHADYWHIGQMYAMANDYEKAIFYMDKAAVDISDEQWIWYYKGTIAFLKRDKPKLQKYADLLGKEHSKYYKVNADALEKLLVNFDKGYGKAILSALDNKD